MEVFQVLKASMFVDLAKCIGCDACSVACKIENATPGNIWWAPVIHTEIGKFPRARISFLPTLCMHCENPPCMKSCPTKAITQTADGIVLINEDRCTGSRACISACPYEAITVWEKENETPDDTGSRHHHKSFLDDLASQKHRIGAAQKCTFCNHRMTAAKLKNLEPGIDREATPACVLTCPAECRIFGDLENEESPVSKYMDEAKKNGRTIFVLRPDANTKPKVAYTW
jgi:phenylacetyl-CoA:acceptor oxidoreductase 27-kDa subunit